MKLAGRNAIITGASQGLGLEIARAYVREGANVLVCARERERIEAVGAELGALAVAADVSKEDDVRDLASRAVSHFGQIHILVNNAGVYGPKGTIDQVDWEEWKRAIEINLYGSVLLCRVVVPHMRMHRYGKIVQLSGGGATNPLPRISAYAASKAAVIRFAETLAEETREHGIDVNAIAPGALNTRLLDEVLEAGPENVGADFYERALKQKSGGGASLERGAALAVYLASAASDGITGKLLSAIWDPWETLADRRSDLGEDVYTLRRITPKDRGFDWGDR
ncbi:MAG TPA: SDR family oxidoreductase [Thermoanaerobaculia bacterium]|nr:SDR family oxidoreductase [Thermoanaerobaculia bacterium]